MKEIAEGTIGIVWMKQYPVPEMSIHLYKTRNGILGWGPPEKTEHCLQGSPTYNKLFPVVSLLQNPKLGAEAFYFTPEEYAAILEGP